MLHICLSRLTLWAVRTYSLCDSAHCQWCHITVYSIAIPVQLLLWPTHTGVTYSFIWASITQYTAVAVPSASLGTVQGLLHGVYYSFGNGIGHFIGGILISQNGAIVTFYIFAVLSAVWLVLFYVCQRVSVSFCNASVMSCLSLLANATSSVTRRLSQHNWMNSSCKIVFAISNIPNRLWSICLNGLIGL
jgi:MFS family permease